MTEPGNEPPALGFFAQLRRRRVIRVAVVYAIAGWVVIEVASTMLPGLHLPAWTDRKMKDVFAIQDDIAQSIVKALQVTLTPQERRAMQSVATSDPAAYD